MASDPHNKIHKYVMVEESVKEILGAKSGDSQKPRSSFGNLSTNSFSTTNYPDPMCRKHDEKLVSVCTKGTCYQRGAICQICQVYDHTDHLDRTWNLQNFLTQIEKQVIELQPGTFELNEFLIDFKLKIKEKNNQIIETMNQIETQVQKMIEKAKESFDKDIDEIKTILKQLSKTRTNQFQDKIYRLTQYFQIDPQTRKVYRSNSWSELYKWKTTDLLMEQKDFFESQVHSALKELQEIAKAFSQFQIPNIDIVEVPKFNPGNIKEVQKIPMAHQNWIRNVQLFKLSEKEISNLNLQNQAQMAKRDPSNEDGLVAIVTNSDDMDVKIWVYSPEDKLFRNLSQITGAHARECLSMRIHYCDDETLSRMSIGATNCNNIIFTSEHGLIKMWDWVARKCINEIKTFSLFTYDFEILRFPQLGLCYATGSKNIIQISDFTSPGGMLKIKEIYPEEQHKEVAILKKIPAGQEDLLVISFIGGNGILKIYNHQGKCIQRIQRQDKEMAFCLEQVRTVKRSSKDNIKDVVVVGSDQGLITAYAIHDGKLLWINDSVHNSWVRGLSTLVVKDSYQFKTLVISNAENENSIQILDGSNGQLLHIIHDAFDSGLRFRSLGCFQGRLEPNLPDSSIIVGGTMKGTLVVFRVCDQN